jgi:hypothetical protein
VAFPPVFEAQRPRCDATVGAPQTGARTSL